MKITNSDYATMKDSIVKIVNTKNPEMYQSYIDAGLSARRFIWDAIHASEFNVCSLYHYLDDTHIDTALRKIIKEEYE